MTPTPPEHGGGPQKYRVGVLVPSLELPLWMSRVIETIRSSEAGRLVVIVVARGSAQPDPHSRGWRHWLYRAYVRLDSAVFSREPNALATRNYEGELGETPVVVVKQSAESGGYPSDDIDRVRGCKLDVLVCLEPQAVNGPLLATARFGCWAPYFGDTDPPGFWEVIEGQPLSVSGLNLVDDVPGSKRSIYRSFGCADRRSVWRNRNHVYLKTAEFAARKLVQLRARKAEAPESCAAASQREDAQARREAPGNAGMMRAMLRLGGRYVVDKVVHATFYEQWRLGIRRDDNTLDPTGLKHLTPPSDRFWADPFLVQRGDQYWVLFEEFEYRLQKGRIACFQFNEAGEHGASIPILENDYHLAYPFVCTWRDDLLMIPDTSENRRIEVYRCVSFPDEWELHHVVMDGVNAVDCTLAEIKGDWWMFATIGVGGGQVPLEELHLFRAPSPLGPWTPHRLNPVKSDVRSARSAGGLVHRNGQWIRPAQDCSVRYGYAISLNRIDRLDLSSYEEVEVARIAPDWAPNVIGIHTVNSVGGMTVFDLRVRVPRWRRSNGTSRGQSSLPLPRGQQYSPEIVDPGGR